MINFRFFHILFIGKTSCTSRGFHSYSSKNSTSSFKSKEYLDYEEKKARNLNKKYNCSKKNNEEGFNYYKKYLEPIYEEEYNLGEKYLKEYYHTKNKKQKSSKSK